MTTEVPPGVATPDRIETRLGTLTSFDGVPDKATTQIVYDNLDFQRGVQAYLSALPVASMAGMRKGLLSFGPPNTTVLVFENLMDSTRRYGFRTNVVYRVDLTCIIYSFLQLLKLTKSQRVRKLTEQLEGISCF